MQNNNPAVLLKKHRNNKSDRVFIITMITIPLIHFILFTVYVNFSSIIMAFQRVDFASNKVVFAGLDNFKRFFEDFGKSDFWTRTILNSFGYFPVTALIMLPLSIIAGYFLYRKIRFHSFYKVIFFMPNIISIVVLGMVFKNMFDPSIGLVNKILTDVFKVNADKIPLWFMDKRYAMMLLYLYSIWAGIGYNVVLLFGAITRIPTDVLESARLDGIGLTGEIFKIIVPIIWPTITTMTVFCVMTVFAQFIHPMVITPGAPAGTWTIAYVVVSQVKQGSFYYAAALGIMVTIVAVPLTMGLRKLMERFFDTVEV